MAGHAILAPSSAYRYLECAASAHYNKVLRTPKENIPADQGTVAHHISYLWFMQVIADFSEVLDKHFVVIKGEVYNHKDYPNHEGHVHLCDSQMVSGMTYYVEEVCNAYNALDPESRKIDFEIRVPIGHVTTEPNAHGTADVIMFDKDRIEVHDLKYGFVEVMSRDNPQLKIYALGAVEFVKKIRQFLPDTIVRTVIHQPRVKEEPDTFDYTLGELQEWAAKNKPAFQRAYAFHLHPDVLEKSQVHYKAGGHCKYCALAAAGCETLHKDVSISAKLAAEALGVDAGIPDEGITSLLSFYKYMDALKTLSIRVGEELVRRIASGENVPGYRLGKGREGNRKWTIEDQKELRSILIAAGIPEDQVDVITVVSPAELSRRVKAGDIPKAVAASIEKEYMERAPGSIQLVPADSSKDPLTADELATFNGSQGVKPIGEM